MSDNEENYDEEEEEQTIPTPPQDPSFSPDSSDRPESDPDYEPTYLKQWNNSLNPSHISCRTAFDILVYCFSPSYQGRNIYRFGSSDACQKQWGDLMLCIKAKSMRFKEPELARKLLKEAREADKISAPHVWNIRQSPPSHIFPKFEPQRPENEKKQQQN